MRESFGPSIEDQNFSAIKRPDTGEGSGLASREGREQESPLQKHDLRTSESYLARAKQLLRGRNVNVDIIESTARQNSEQGSVPAQFVLRIFDPLHKGLPASAEYMKSVYSYLKQEEPEMPLAFGDAALRSVSRY